MTRVDFYILSEDHNSLEFVSRLTEQIFRQGHKLHIHADDPGMVDRVDKLLWTYRDISFIPHERNLGADTSAAVTLGHGDAAPASNEILINLANNIPDFFSRFERVVEIIEADDSHRQQGRVRYKYYRDRGYELTNHDIK